MRLVPSIATLLLLLPAAHGGTALDALKQLPKDQLPRVARIEARDGSPDPDRWYILTHDPSAENGLHEFVVADGKIVASRSVSQFAETLKSDDVLPGDSLKIDSDKAAKLARSYADANGAAVTTINYELKKARPDTAPVWTVSCLDDQGNKLGVLVLTAGKGSVVSHEGFTVAPEPESTPAPEKKEKPHPEPRRESLPKPDKPDAAFVPTPIPLRAESSEEIRPTIRPATRVEASPAKKPNALQKVGDTLHKFLPF